MSREAVLWTKRDDGKIQCQLCAHGCVISEGKVGFCRVRRNDGGTLVSLNYDRVCAANADPIEKKPLYHFYPGTDSFSISAPGCNFRCSFCQNWQISQVEDEDSILGRSYLPEQIVTAAKKANCQSIAYTYTEPTIFMELSEQCGRLARSEGLKNVFVSNGYMSAAAIDFMQGWLDAINVDLKAFTEAYYQNFCKARLAPVLENIETIARHTDIWLEVTTLIIPGENDSEDELKALAGFLAEKAGPEVPWHISRFYPQHELTYRPATAPEALNRALEIGYRAGLKYIYIGNMPGASAQDTLCHHCGHTLIVRSGYHVRPKGLIDGRCEKCKAVCAGRGM